MGIPKSTRVVVTIPPASWFGGYDYISTISLVKQLERRFGIEFYQLDVTPWTFDNTFTQQKYVEELREYRPDIAIALNNSGYGFLCSTKSDGAAHNLFTDILGIPLLMPWDHALFQFPTLVSHHYPDSVSKGRNILQRVRAVVDNPLMHHLPIDGAQVSEMRRIDMLTSGNVAVAPAAAYLPYLEFGRARERTPTTAELVFVGNIYAGSLESETANSELEHDIRDAVLISKGADPLANSWKLLINALSSIPDADKIARQLDFDDAYFWSFADKLITRNCNMIARTSTLGSIAREVTLYGEFAAGSSAANLRSFSNIRYNGFVDFASELPAVYAGTEILVDIANASFMTNCSSKPICCLAAGGFPLFDYKESVASYLGEDAKLLMYKTADELNSKIDYYLTHPNERKQLAESLKDKVRHNCDFADIVYNAAERILNDRPKDQSLQRPSGDANAISDVMRKPAKVFGLSDIPGPDAITLIEFNLRNDLFVQADWDGARIVDNDPAVVQTAESAWGYSAYLDLREYAQLLEVDGRHWLAVDCRCIRGQCAISLMYGDQLAGERALLPSSERSLVYFWVQFTKGLTGMMIRSHGEGASLVELGSIRFLQESSSLESGAMSNPAKISPLSKSPGPTATTLIEFNLLNDLFIQADWDGAQIVANDPVVIQTAEPAWGYSAHLDLRKYAQLIEVDGLHWLAVDCRCIKGQCAISLMYGDQLAGERALLPSSKSSVVYFLIQFTKGLTGMMVRSHGEGSSLFELSSIKLLQEALSLEIGRESTL